MHPKYWMKVANKEFHWFFFTFHCFGAHCNNSPSLAICSPVSLPTFQCCLSLLTANSKNHVAKCVLKHSRHSAACEKWEEWMYSVQITNIILTRMWSPVNSVYMRLQRGAFKYTAVHSIAAWRLKREQAPTTTTATTTGRQTLCSA